MPIPVCILLIINDLHRFLVKIFRVKTKKEGSYILPSPNYYKQNQLKPRGIFQKKLSNFLLLFTAFLSIFKITTFQPQMHLSKR